MNRPWIIAFPILIALSKFAAGDDIPLYELDSVVVTASRIPTTFSTLARGVEIIGREEIAAAPAFSIEDILACALSVDIRRRGSQGVQGDVGIRGASFEQTLVLIDGLKVSDPQTGHHNLDLPLNISEIERIEILKGPGSKLYGPNVTGGVINVITCKDSAKRGRLKAAVGEYGLFERSALLSYSLGRAVHTLTFTRRNSTGYRNNTEHDITVLSYGAGVNTGGGRVNLCARYIDKEFGAYKFYSDNLPDEWEATETTFLSADADLQTGKATILPKLFWRRHKDDFVLDRNRPEWYRNLHTTDQYGVEIHARLTSSRMIVAFGGELAGEEIESGSLGNHYRTRRGLFGEMRLTLSKNLSIVPGLSLYGYSDRAWKVWPGVDLAYQMAAGWRLYCSVGKSFRVPTFTDLYYDSPANRGNPDLQPEISWSYEIGTDWNRDAYKLELAVFLRDCDNLIDWARNDPAKPWRVLNISEVTTIGVEIGTRIYTNRLWRHSPITSIRACYTFLDSGRKTGGHESKYAMDHLKHQAVFDIKQKWLHRIRQNWKMRYIKRLNRDDYFVVDTRLLWRHKRTALYIEAFNLFNTAYVESGTIPMPGRWLSAGLTIYLFNAKE